jgi:O-acetyl-ADP-ribose deacetylase (regulator of RNase III)
MMSLLERISIIQGDITKQSVDAIVNAANTSLLGGGGVDGAIHRAAGPELLKECRTLGGCDTGDAKLTNGYLLPATYVIHTVGPIWHGGKKREDEFLMSCYRRCFEIANERGIRSIAFPSISTGAYGFPVERASRIALREMSTALEENNALRVRVVCFDERTYSIYRKAAEEISRPES